MKLRMRFGKVGMVKFIGHLDIMRYFQKAFRRAGVDIKYSQGFHPHPSLSFASPLGVGLESSGEYLDMEVNSFDDLDEMKKALNEQMVDGITVLSIHHLPDDAKTSMALIAAADYEVHFREDMMPCDSEKLKEIVENFIAQEEIKVIKVMKDKKKKHRNRSNKDAVKEKEIDIRPLIYDLHMVENDGIFMQVTAGSVANLKPELVMQALYEFAGFTFDSYALLVTRRDMYTDIGDESKRQLVSLDDYMG